MEADYKAHIVFYLTYSTICFHLLDLRKHGSKLLSLPFVEIQTLVDVSFGSVIELSEMPLVLEQKKI